MGEVFEVIAIGRVGVDLYPNQSGVGLADVSSFTRYLGGTAANVAVAAARLGHRSALVSRVGTDPFGDYVRRALDEFGVDSRFVSTDPELRTPLAFCELHPPDHFPLLFYREPKAPDMNLAPTDLPLDEVRSARILWTTGSALSDEPSRTTTLQALASRTDEAITIHDLDYRPMFWDSPNQAGDRQREALHHATVAVGNLEEAAVVLGPGRAADLAIRLIEEFEIDLAVVKLGPQGVLVATADGVCEQVPPVTVEVVNGLGAGDAFGGALCHGLLHGWDLVETIRFANAAGAFVAAHLACADAMPNEHQIRALMQRGVTS